MPLKSLLDPKTFEEVPLDKAADYFDEKGLVPREVIRLILSGEGRDDGGVYVSPSLCDPTTTCRREQVLKRFCSYSLNPLKVWMAMEGSIYHEAMERQGAGEGYGSEEVLPDVLAEVAKGRGVALKLCADGKLRMEVWPGVWMRGRLDRRDPDWLELVDFKTTRYAKTDYGKKPEWVLKMNVYARMVELLRGRPFERMWAWRIYRGSYDMDRVFRKFDIPRLKPEQMDKVGAFALSMQEMFQRAAAAFAGGGVQAVEAVVAELPMDGKGMFNGKKCDEYCALRDKCYQIEGIPTF
jgi:hypothetical protein